MSRFAAAVDHAAMESLFSLLHKNLLDTRRWATGDRLSPHHDRRHRLHHRPRLA